MWRVDGWRRDDAGRARTEVPCNAASLERCSVPRPSSDFPVRLQRRPPRDPTHLASALIVVVVVVQASVAHLLVNLLLVSSFSLGAARSSAEAAVLARGIERSDVVSVSLAYSWAERFSLASLAPNVTHMKQQPSLMHSPSQAPPWKTTQRTMIATITPFRMKEWGQVSDVEGGGRTQREGVPIRTYDGDLLSRHSHFVLFNAVTLLTCTKLLLSGSSRW